MSVKCGCRLPARSSTRSLWVANRWKGRAKLLARDGSRPWPIRQYELWLGDRCCRPRVGPHEFSDARSHPEPGWCASLRRSSGSACREAPVAVAGDHTPEEILVALPRRHLAHGHGQAGTPPGRAGCAGFHSRASDGSFTAPGTSPPHGARRVTHEDGTASAPGARAHLASTGVKPRHDPQGATFTLRTSRTSGGIGRLERRPP
jgi:hypothetical protein